MDATQIRRWIAGFEAAADADRQALRDRGIDRARSIGLSLSMIAAGRRALGGRVVDDPLREAEDERIREVWRRLRARLRRVKRDHRSFSTAPRWMSEESSPPSASSLRRSTTPDGPTLSNGC